MAVTIRDVAKLAGVSASTVSRTCNNNPSISEETKEKVRKAMEELGYNAPSSAKVQAAERNNCNKIRHMGIILPPSNTGNYENTFHLRAIRGISRYCAKGNYSNTVITGETRHEILSIVQRMVEGNDVDGFIFLYSSIKDPVIEYLYHKKVPYVLVGKAAAYANNTMYVDNDNLLAGQTATEYLFALNHKKIGYIGYSPDTLFSYERQSGYQLSLMQHGVAFNPDYVINDNEPPLTEDCAVAKLLKSPNRPTGFVIADDSLAIAVMQLCIKFHMSIPNDISLIAFNNSMLSLLTSPQLTSIDVNAVQLGEAAATQLAERLDSSNALLPTKIIVPHKLIERLSCTWCDD